MTTAPEWALAIEAMMHAKERHKISGKFRGRFPCPKCKKGTIHWTVVARNKHSRGQCSTPECISWME